MPLGVMVSTSHFDCGGAGSSPVGAAKYTVGHRILNNIWWDVGVETPSSKEWPAAGISLWTICHTAHRDMA